MSAPGEKPKPNGFVQADVLEEWAAEADRAREVHALAGDLGIESARYRWGWLDSPEASQVQLTPTNAREATVQLLAERSLIMSELERTKRLDMGNLERIERLIRAATPRMPPTAQGALLDAVRTGVTVPALKAQARRAGRSQPAAGDPLRLAALAVRQTVSTDGPQLGYYCGWLGTRMLARWGQASVLSSAVMYAPSTGGSVLPSAADAWRRERIAEAVADLRAVVKNPKAPTWLHVRAIARGLEVQGLGGDAASFDQPVVVRATRRVARGLLARLDDSTAARPRTEDAPAAADVAWYDKVEARALMQALRVRLWTQGQAGSTGRGSAAPSRPESGVVRQLVPRSSPGSVR